ncbi:MAG: hypothetical protein JXQ73_18185 [Phycisphaerae bacterium]|nr:hypothetical protein [Phycisphaerae bacterium]
MTVTDLVMNLHAALRALVPCVERVGLPWKRPDAYDEWDNIAAALYQALVVEPLRFSLPERERDRFSLPAYDLLLPSYADKSIIEVLPAESDGRIGAFHALGTLEAPFDVVEWRAVNRTGLPESERLETIPLESARFALRLNANGISDTRVDRIAIV